MTLLFWLKKVFFSLAPLTLLLVVLGGTLRLVQSETVNPQSGLPAGQLTQVADPGTLRTSDRLPLQTPVAPQSVVIEAKATSDAGLQPLPESNLTPSESIPATGQKPEQVWQEINQAISGLNELVGDEMFLDVKRKQKGQLEIRLDQDLWKRVMYETRVDLKTDISNLWHLYVSEYGTAGSSVVYFIDGNNERVIDIFSRAK